RARGGARRGVRPPLPRGDDPAPRGRARDGRRGARRGPGPRRERDRRRDGGGAGRRDRAHARPPRRALTREPAPGGRRAVARPRRGRATAVRSGGQQYRFAPVVVPRICANCWNAVTRDWTWAGLPPLHSIEPLIERIDSPKPAPETIAWWPDIVPAPDCVFQNHSPVFHATAESCSTRYGLLSRSMPSASPAAL